MKKIFYIIILSIITVNAYSQKRDQYYLYADSLISRWCIDVNFKGGLFNENINTVNYAYPYSNYLNDTIGSLKFSNGYSYGFDAQLGYFFGRKRHWGLGIGVMYLMQQGDLSLDKFKLEYKSLDAKNDTFRQVLAANGPIKESIRINNWCLPLVLKIKKQFSPHWGFTADLGLLFNLQMQNKYTSNASFNYEAIYKYVNGKPVYDYSPTPGTTDQLITQAMYNSHSNNNNYTSVNAFFDANRANGSNVGLNVNPTNNSGSINYKGSIGFLIQPSVTYRVTDYFFLNMGLYYILQNYSNSSSVNNVKITDQVGSYNSVMNGVSSSQNNSFGINLGIRLFFGSIMDGERRHNPYNPVYKDANEKPDYERLYNEYGERYKDSVENKPDKQKTYYRELPYKVIHFETAKYNLDNESIRKLDEIARFMKDNPDVFLRISGHTDIVGTEKYNQVLSENRAEAVKQYLEYKGIDASRMTTRGYNSRYPVETNRTEEGKARNRRSEMEIRVK